MILITWINLTINVFSIHKKPIVWADLLEKQAKSCYKPSNFSLLMFRKIWLLSPPFHIYDTMPNHIYTRGGAKCKHVYKQKMSDGPILKCDKKRLREMIIIFAKQQHIDEPNWNLEHFNLNYDNWNHSLMSTHIIFQERGLMTVNELQQKFPLSFATLKIQFIKKHF